MSKDLSITQIITFPNSPKVELLLSDNRRVALFLAQLTSLNLAIGVVSPVLLNQIFAESWVTILTDYALKLISIAPQPPALLSLKLKKKIPRLQVKHNLPPLYDEKATISSVFDYLQSRHLLSAGDFISYFVRRHSRQSVSFVKMRLRRLGFSEAEIIPYLSDQDQEYQKVKSILVNKIKYGYSFKSKVDQAKMKSRLYRQGFSLSVINKAFDDLSLKS